MRNDALMHREGLKGQVCISNDDKRPIKILISMPNAFCNKFPTHSNAIEIDELICVRRSAKQIIKSFRFYLIHMLWVYGHYKYFTLSVRDRLLKESNINIFANWSW